MLDLAMFSSFRDELTKIAGAGEELFGNTNAGAGTVAGRKPKGTQTAAVAPTQAKPSAPTQTAHGPGGKLPGPARPDASQVAQWDAHRQKVMAGHEKSTSVVGHAPPHPANLHAPNPSGVATASHLSASPIAARVRGAAGKLGKGGLVAAGLGTAALGMGAMGMRRQQEG